MTDPMERYEANHPNLDYGCVEATAGETDPGLFFCAAHLSYGYRRDSRCHKVGAPSWLATRAYDGPVLSPFVARALSAQLPAKALDYRTIDPRDGGRNDR